MMHYLVSTLVLFHFYQTLVALNILIKLLFSCWCHQLTFYYLIHTWALGCFCFCSFFKWMQPSLCSPVLNTLTCLNSIELLRCFRSLKFPSSCIIVSWCSYTCINTFFIQVEKKSWVAITVTLSYSWIVSLLVSFSRCTKNAQQCCDHCLALPNTLTHSCFIYAWVDSFGNISVF